MIGIVLVTHGNLAREFLAALEHVVGPQQCISAVCIGAEDDMEKRRAEILESAKACDTGDGVIVLTDMFGGTPSNLAISIMEQARIEVLAGVNLPMLVKLASVRSRPVASTSPSPRASSPRKLRDGPCAGRGGRRYHRRAQAHSSHRQQARPART